MLPSLKTVELSNNSIASLQYDIGKLTSLKVLNLADNKLNELPDSFKDLPCLTAIDLSDNHIKSLPSQMKCHATLERFFMENNWLPTLPKWFSNMPRIVAISLRNNQLQYKPLEDSFGKVCDRLKTLDLAGNYFTELPESLGRLKQLEFLHMVSVINELERRNFQNGNCLARLPTSLSQLTSLKQLQLEQNTLEELPEQFGCLVNLHTLDLGIDSRGGHLLKFQD